MANNTQVNNKIGCSAGKTSIVDPNNFEGFNSSSNMPVSQEDLTISVVLKTFKRGRTVLDEESSTFQSSRTVQVNFIEGTDITGSGRKSLTSSFTELTTIFDKNDLPNHETLGITSIDIDFNSSYAPMITINFVDVRGSSIYQNEEKIVVPDSKNKYASFFQIPYPIFELEIKGYYGKPVTYCLHMLKFNSKFNSKNGNFEIQCQFVGYTYAMFSDMLIGYLKAIPYSDMGTIKYNEIRTARAAKGKPNNEVIDLVELMKRISAINFKTKKVASNSDNSVKINNVNAGTEALDAIKVSINQIAASWNFNKETVKSTDAKYIFRVNTPTIEKTEKNAVNTYLEGAKKQIEVFNNLNLGAQLDVNLFTNINPIGVGRGYYSKMTKQMLDPNSTASTDTSLSQKLGSDQNLQKFKKDVTTYLNANYTITNDLVFDFYDMSNLFAEIEKAQTTINGVLKTAREGLALELKENVRDTLGFEPTVRKIIEIFTIAIEVFMECVYDVSFAAEKSDNVLRNTELERKFKPDSSQITDYSKADLEAKKFFSWPDYREKDEISKSYVEKYLGTKGVLDVPTNVDEIRFIDDLLRGFIKARQVENEITNEENQLTWYPINPFDTKLFIADDPYTRAELHNPNDVCLMVIIRAMIYFGYTNHPDFITQGELDNLVNVEVDALIRGLKDDLAKKSAINLGLQSFIDAAGAINFSQRNVINSEGNFYVYDYILSEFVPHKVLPLSTGFFNNFEWPLGDDELKALADNFNIFLTNYGSAASDPSGKLIKPEDGGQYIKIMSNNKYTDEKDGVNLFPITVTQNETPTISLKKSPVLDFEKIKEKTLDINSGFESITNDNYGIQDLSKINFDSLKDAPLMYTFYLDKTDSSSFMYKKSSSSYVFKPKDHVRVIFNDTNPQDAYSGFEQNRIALNTVDTDGTVTYPFIQYRIRNFRTERYNISLFGSPWYYYQSEAKCKLDVGNPISCEQYAKGLLFLNTLPFNNPNGDPFGPPEIINLFNKKGGFIHVPRLWCAYVGAMLWWKSDDAPEVENGKIVGGGSGIGDPLSYKRFDDDGDILFYLQPEKTHYFPKEMEYGTDLQTNGYVDIKAFDKINTLPDQVKNEFKRIFFEFINGPSNSTDSSTDGFISFREIVGNLEIWNGTAKELSTFLSQPNPIRGIDGKDGEFYESKVIEDEPKFKNLNFTDPNPTYDVVTFWPDSIDNIGRNEMLHPELVLGLRGDYSSNEAISKLINAMNQEVVIANSGYKIWDNPTPTSFVKYEKIRVDKVRLETYINAFIARLAAVADSFNPETVNNKLEQQIFGTANEDVIKLQLYRTCKNIKDKWLGGLRTKDDMIFQCGNFKRNGVDTKLSEEYGSDKLRLIDSFRFISRSFSDIGNKLFINPTPINDYLHDNPNTSAYDAISSILASNNFEFIALPTFINFKNPTELETIFQPFEYNIDKIPESACGPSFVCVYIGQKSKHLDLNDSNYPTDGFDLRCDNGNMSTSVPDDFKSDNLDHEDAIGAFVVKYSQQNQNIFKDISLDQSEFSETDESIQIQDDISRKGAETNRSIVGQNLYNVYSVRSYTAQVEMMGNAMIQPMMYFQLDNIPMFHGAYMITRVKHSIVPNSMSTNFTGVRIKQTQTKLVDAMDVYMSLIDEQNLEGATGGGGTTTLNVAPIVATIVENGGVNGNIVGETGFITTTTIPHIDGFSNAKAGSPNENKLLTEAVVPFVEMVKAWIDYMSKNGFKGSGTGKAKIYAGLSSAFRDIEGQRATQGGPNAAADVGRSYHGWGVAVDLQMYTKEGNPIKIKQNPANFLEANNPALIWLLDNSWKYGWVIPYPMRDKAGTSDEFWHFEYHGTAAKCLMSDSFSNTYGHKTVIGKDAVQKLEFVKNPKGKDGIPAVYTGCDYRDVIVDGVDTILGGDADYWALLSVCSCEAGTPQGRCDAAQVVYNRLSVPKKGYGRTVKEIVIKDGQFAVTFKNDKNKLEWAQISDEASAIIAVKGSKGNVTDAQAKKLLSDTNAALKDPKLQASSRAFIGTRTNFLGYFPEKPQNTIGIINRTSGADKSNHFFWEKGTEGVAIQNNNPPNPPVQFA